MMKSLERYKMVLASVNLNTSALVLLLTALKQRRKVSKRLLSNTLHVASLILSCVLINHELVALPRVKPPSQGSIKDVSAWDDVQFYIQFRFRKGHFYHFLDAIRWLDARGRPLVMKFGNKGHKYTMRTDHLMMILLKQLGFPCCWADVMLILCGCETTLSDAFRFVLQYLYFEYVPLIQDLNRWKDRFPEFAKRLADMGAPYDNLISFVDSHFDPSVRPGGDGCARLNLKDYQCYNILHKGHWLMFQGLVLVNGWAMVWGPFRGNANDAKSVIKADIIEDLKKICDEIGVTYSHFADSAYPVSRYMQAILKNPAGGSLSAGKRRFNSLMARFRVVIENLFAEIENQFAFLQHHQNKKLGLQDVGKLFPVAMFLFNARTLYYGSQTANYYGLDGVADLSLHQVLQK